MGALVKEQMTSDAFIAWAMERQEGERYELFAGEIVRMSPERLSHARVKFQIARVLDDALRAQGVAGEILVDGMAVEIDATTVYEPDVLMRCGPDLPGDTVKLTDPILVVEVVSPSSRQRDAVIKLGGYIRVPSIRHYLVVTIASRSIAHHRRDEAGRIQTRNVRQGALVLDPPGLTVDIAAFFA